MKDQNKTQNQLLDELMELRRRVAELEVEVNERKCAEETLQEYQKVIENSKDMISVVDQHYKYLLANATFLKYRGLNREQVVGRSAPEVLGKDVFEKVVKKNLDTCFQGEVVQYEMKYIYPELGERDLLVSYFPIENPDGINQVVSFIRDITHHKRAEETLQRSEEEAKRMVQENAIMAEIGQIISSTLNINEVYERFAEEVRKLIPFDRIMINLADLKNKTSTPTYMAGIDVPGRRVGDITPLAGTVTEEVVRTRSSLLIQVVNDNIDEVVSRFPPLLLTFQAGLRSLIFAPLISKDQVIGVLSLRAAKINAYTEMDLRLAGRVGNQIAGAIANAQLFIELQKALTQVKQLSGLLPICASCKKIRDDKGYWNQIESYIRDRSEAEFSHGICPECMKKLYPGFDEEV